MQSLTNYEIFKLLFGDFIKKRQEKNNREYLESSKVMFETRMGNFFKWLDSMGIKMLEVTKEDIMNYRRSSGKIRTTNNEYSKMMILKEFYEMFVSKTIIKSNPFDGLIFKKEESGNRYVMPYNEIRIYRSLHIDIRMAAAFEVFISSGIRLSDLCNIRCCDVHVGKVVFDRIENCKSKYIGAAILIDPRSVRTKTRKRRLTYISVFALKILKMYMDVMGYNFKSEAPLFPWATQTFAAYFYEIGLKFREERDKFYSKENSDSRALSINTDLITGDSFTGDGMNKNLVRRIKTRMKNIDKKNSKDGALADDISDKLNLHIHSFRHTFASLMYYRDWAGGRKDVAYIAHLLGHKFNSAVTYDYLKATNVVNSDSDWKSIWSGLPSDWKNVIVKQTDRGGWGTFGIDGYHKKGIKYLPYKIREAMKRREEEKMKKMEEARKRLDGNV